MQHPSLSPVEMFASPWRHRSLVKSLIRRDVLGRYQGSMLGVLWSFFNPLLMLAIYTFVFSVVFKARWSGGGESKTEFALLLFAGMLVFNMFAECINRAPVQVLGNPNFVKKVVFPLEILAWSGVGSALFHLVINVVVWLGAYIVLFGIPSATALLLPLVLLPLLLMSLGFSWLLSSVGVYLRDVSQFVGVATTAMMFLSPIFYPANALPEEYRPLLLINPVTPVINFSRDVLYWGRMPDFFDLSAYFAVSLVVSWLGFAGFQKARKGFADVI